MKPAERETRMEKLQHLLKRLENSRFAPLVQFVKFGLLSCKDYPFGGSYLCDASVKSFGNIHAGVCTDTLADNFAG